MEIRVAGNANRPQKRVINKRHVRKSSFRTVRHTSYIRYAAYDETADRHSPTATTILRVSVLPSTDVKTENIYFHFI